MKRGFTLLELLVVVAIMGLMGTAAVGGYRQMRRGMEERRVVDNVSKFLTLAAERAQIDRQPVSVFYWNEMLREETDDEPEILVGKAVAVRRSGRITMIVNGCLIDEYGDFEQYEYDKAEGKEKYNLSNQANDHQKKRMYRMDDLSVCTYSEVSSIPVCATPSRPMECYVSSNPFETLDNLGAGGGNQGTMVFFGYKGSISGWQVGSSYGFEFQRIELPHDYVFDSGLPSGISSPGSIAVRSFTLQSDSETANIGIQARRQGAGGNVVSRPIGTAKVENK